MTTILPGQTIDVGTDQRFQTISGVFVDGGYMDVVSGGVATATTLEARGYDPGLQEIHSGGSAFFTVISSGGAQIIFPGGVSVDTTILYGGFEFVSGYNGQTGGVAVGTMVSRGGTFAVCSGNDGIDTTIRSGGVERLSGVMGVGGGVGSDTTVSNGGKFEVYSGGSALFTTVSSGGMEIISSGGVASSTTVSSGGLEVIDSSGSATDTVIDPGGAIDVAYIPYVSGATISVNGSDLLTVTDPGGGVAYSQQLAGSYAGDTFTLSDDGAGGTLITENTPCYCRGTRILTDHDEVAVEDLAIGDRLVTLEGEAKRVRWIGRRRFAGWQAAGNPDIEPIRFKAGSIGDHVPARDLLVSPEHAMFLDGVLIPARHLVNGVSILPAEAMEEVEYFHLELERHDVIFAEGAASETFLDDDSRGMFNNAYTYHRLYPDAPRRVEAVYCAPRVEDGYELEAVRRRLNGRAARLGPDGTAAPAPALLGHLERVTRHLIEGWAFQPGDPDARVTLTILANGAEIGRVLADRHRPDLAEAGVGDGGHAFMFALPRGFAPDRAHEVEVRRAGDWTPLPGAPKMLEAAPGA